MEIKFRGLRIDGGWVYGSLIIHNAYDLKDGSHKPCAKRMLIESQDIKWVNDPDNKRWTYPVYEVLPETVGQYTGMRDMNGVEIYDGDILKDAENALFSVEWDSYVYSWTSTQTTGRMFMLAQHNPKLIEVIGNRHDKSELSREK